MRFLPFVLAAAALASASFVVVQANDDPKPTLTHAEQSSVDAKLAAMQGLWRLKDFHSLKVEPARRVEVGYLLVSGLCFSLELHWGWTTQDNARFADKDFQSGTHRFELDEAGFLEARSLIGSAFTREGLLQWEQPGRVRKYKVELIGETMIWTNDDGTSFTFEHMPEPRTARRDVFGRPIPEKKKPEDKPAK